MGTEAEKELRSLIAKNNLVAIKDLLWNKYEFEPGPQFHFLLEEAVIQGRIDMVRYFLALGCKVNGLSEHQETPLLCAAKFGKAGNRLDLLRMLLKEGADPKVVDNHGEGAFSYFLEQEDIECAILLLQQKRPSHYDELLRMLLLYDDPKVIELQSILKGNEAKQVRLATEQSLLHVAAAVCNVPATRYYLSVGNDVNHPSSALETPLIIASKSSRKRFKSEELLVLLSAGASLNYVDERWRGAIHHCAIRPSGDVDSIRVLLDVGANVNQPDIEKNSPLHLASRLGNIQVMRFLLENGASVIMCNNAGNTALHEAVHSLEAVRRDPHRHCQVLELLLQHRANPNKPNNANRTAFQMLLKVCQLPALEAFLNYGANTEAVTEKGETTLHLVASNSDWRLTSVMIDKLVDLDTRTFKGFTALHLAVQQVIPDNVALICRSGALVNAYDSLGNTPLLLLVRSDAFKLSKDVELITIAKILLDYGADVTSRNARGISVLDMVGALKHAELSKTILKQVAILNSLDPRVPANKKREVPAEMVQAFLSSTNLLHYYVEFQNELQEIKKVKLLNGISFFDAISCSRARFSTFAKDAVKRFAQMWDQDSFPNYYFTLKSRFNEELRDQLPIPEVQQAPESMLGSTSGI